MIVFMRTLWDYYAYGYIFDRGHPTFRARKKVFGEVFW